MPQHGFAAISLINVIYTYAAAAPVGIDVNSSGNRVPDFTKHFIIALIPFRKELRDIIMLIFPRYLSECRHNNTRHHTPGLYRI